MSYAGLKAFATDRQLEIIDAIESTGTQKKAAKRLNITLRSLERSVQNLKSRAEKRGYSPLHDMNHPVPGSFSVSGVSTNYGPDGEIKQQWVKSATDKHEDSKESMRDFIEAFINPYKGKSRPVKAPKGKDNQLLNMYALGDPHFGMRAWSKETGHDSHDIDIAENDLKAALDISIENAPDADTAIFANMGDALHANTDKPFTAAGTLLDTDGRMSNTVDAIARAFRHGIDKLRKKHKNVIVINLRGNHDPFSGLMLNKLIQAYYENDSRVTVLDNERKNINMLWGDVMLSFLHGDKMNSQKWVNMLARDHAPMWGKAKFRYGYQGHLHHESVQEISGITLEVIRTLASVDSWHADSGYGSTRAMSTITFDKRFGRLSRFDCPIEMVRHNA